ncbi:MAG: triose-phosphate isomerase [Gammaproteobacteria bacterium]|jgi:triosephosphate isomerase
MARQALVVGNWKMHGNATFARELAGAIVARAGECRGIEIAVCPPHVLLSAVAEVVAGSAVALGAQTVSEFNEGAYTGETAPAMLVELGCRFVIVGHSERRHLFGETSAAVAAKAQAAVAAGLTPIICVGEQLDDRKADTTNAVIAAQLEPIGADVLGQCVVAYEPVWAIGTGETATPEQAQAVHAFIRQTVAARDADAAAALRILYGGSVKPDNAAELFQMADVDGGLIGGAALKAPDFLQICGSL